jgi:hypothetical protein
MVQSGGRLVFVADRCILATKENTGGYALLTVFGVNFAHIVNEVLGSSSRAAKVLVSRNLWHYLPSLVWDVRTARTSRHLSENPWPGMRRELGRQSLFWLLLVPLERLPIWLARPYYLLWRILHRVAH